ncbi:KCD19 protein, partial [Pandion haliaetus]|nr:KCD19 protein [Pandion haliaetus]
KESERVMESAEEELINFNVGGWYFSIPKSKVAQFPESLLWKEASVQDQSENLRLFIDQDGFVFRHLHYYMQTSKLSFFSCAELNLLYEQALILQLTPLLQILDNLKEEKYNLCVQTADIPVAERTSLNYRRAQKCISKPPEIPPNSPAFTGLHERAPLGLVDTPLLDTEDEVNYCFLPLDLVAKYPVLVNDNNLLWLLENAALIECKCSEFRFIVNFLRSEKMLLPHDFSNIDALEEEVLILGIPELIDAVKIYRGNRICSLGAGGWQGAVAGESLPRSPLYTMALGLLANYPDSTLGQLCVGSDLGRSRLHLSGDGILFQHARNWLGTCRLPLTENISEIKDLCAYLDKRDTTYEPMKDALKCYLKQQTPAGSRDYNTDWTAEVSVCSLHQIVKVYVGSNWYETYLQTLLKYPELLSNDKKVCWITYGQSLLIHGDGQMFRHVLNFLRLGKLFLPAEFKEWPLFCQEAEEYQIPSLSEALYCSDAYRLWIQNNELHNEVSFPCKRLSTVSWNDENEFSKDPKEMYSPTAVDPSKCYINTWSNIKDLKGKQETSGAKYSKIILRAKGTKRRNTLGGYDESSDSLVNSSYYKHLVSPPRKRGMRSALTKKGEGKDSASHIQKLISLVKEWDAVNSKRCDFQHVRTSDGCTTDSILQCNTPKKERGVKAPVASAPGKISFTIQGNSHVTQYEVGAEGKQPEQYVFTKSLPVTPSSGMYRFSTIKITPTAGNDAENINREQPEGKGLLCDCFAVKLNVYSFTETRDGKQTNAVLADHRNVGLILKVEHPPVLGSDGFCTTNEESVVYSALWDGSQRDTPNAQALSKDIVFLTFALSREEIFYARKCHFFLTNVILDSVRLKDPREITAKVGTLVNRLWTQQITPREFVADLLDTQYFQGDRNVHEELLQWVEFTLPFAWKYSCCLDLLIRRGFARSVSYFALEM